MRKLPTPAPTGANCFVAKLGREAKHLTDEQDRLDAERLAKRDELPPGRAETDVDDRLDTVARLAVLTKAESLLGALFQAQLLSYRIEVLESHPDSRETEAQLKAHLSDMQRLAYSICGAIKKVVGDEANQLPGDSYMPDDLSPALYTIAA